MEKPLETVWVGPKVGLGRASGNHQSGANNVRQVDGVSVTVPACLLCGSVGEGTMAPASTSVWEKAATSFHTGARQFSSFSCLCCLSMCCPMLELRGVGPSKSVHRLFKGKCPRLQQFLSFTALILTGFYSQTNRGLSSWHWNSGLGLVWGWDSLLLRYLSWFLSTVHGCGTCLIHRCALLPISMWFHL